MAFKFDVVCDFETASACDIKKCGAARYAQDPSTEVLCFVWEAHGQLDWWSPYIDNPGSWTRLAYLVDNPRATFVSHASFEQFIWRYIMVPLGMAPLAIDRWHDTQAVAAWHGHPLKLETLAKVINLAVQKDMEGSKLTIGLSKPITKVAWAQMFPGPASGTMADWMRRYPAGMCDRTVPTLERVIDYCKTDVRTEAAAHRKMGRLSRGEAMVWRLDQEINHRGVRIDLDFVRAAQRVIERAKKPLEEEFRQLTGGVGPGQVEKIVEWCGANGLPLENLQKDTLARVLGEEDEDGLAESDVGGSADTAMWQSGGLPSSVKRVLEIRQMLGSAAIRKLDRALACTGYDGRARGLTQYHAGITGRWGGRLLQPHNFPWDKEGVLGKLDPEIAVAAILSGDPAYVEMMLGVPAIVAVGLSLRHMLIADPGKTFLVGDFSGVEARIVLALAGQHDKTALMASGQDVYLDMACDIYDAPKGSLTKTADPGKRDIGKKTVLGAGFQMGPAKFHDRYCPDQPIEFAERIIEAYRKSWAPKVPELWYALERVALTCARTGETGEVNGCRVSRQGQFIAIDLPSGWQRLWYFKPQWHPHRLVGGVPEPSSKPSWDYLASKHGTPQRLQMYGGLITENCVQALARGLLCTAMGRLTQAGMPLVMTVHDEAICEVDEDHADEVRFKQIMSQPTDWSDTMGVPIAVDTWTGARYRK